MKRLLSYLLVCAAILIISGCAGAFEGTKNKGSVSLNVGTITARAINSHVNSNINNAGRSARADETDVIEPWDCINTYAAVEASTSGGYETSETAKLYFDFSKLMEDSEYLFTKFQDETVTLEIPVGCTVTIGIKISMGWDWVEDKLQDFYDYELSMYGENAPDDFTIEQLKRQIEENVKYTGDAFAFEGKSEPVLITEGENNVTVVVREAEIEGPEEITDGQYYYILHLQSLTSDSDEYEEMPQPTPCNYINEEGDSVDLALLEYVQGAAGYYVNEEKSDENWTEKDGKFYKNIYMDYSPDKVMTETWQSAGIDASGTSYELVLSKSASNSNSGIYKVTTTMYGTSGFPVSYGKWSATSAVAEGASGTFSSITFVEKIYLNLSNYDYLLTENSQTVDYISDGFNFTSKNGKQVNFGAISLISSQESSDPINTGVSTDIILYNKGTEQSIYRVGHDFFENNETLSDSDKYSNSNSFVDFVIDRTNVLFYTDGENLYTDDYQNPFSTPLSLSMSHSSSSVKLYTGVDVSEPGFIFYGASSEENDFLLGAYDGGFGTNATPIQFTYENIEKWFDFAVTLESTEDILDYEDDVYVTGTKFTGYLFLSGKTSGSNGGIIFLKIPMTYTAKSYNNGDRYEEIISLDEDNIISEPLNSLLSPNSSNAAITDMVLQDGYLYVLFRDQYIDTQASTGAGVGDVTKEWTSYSRGALIKMSQNLTSVGLYRDTTSEGEILFTYEEEPTYNAYFYQSDINSFVGPQKFIAIKPKKLVIADDGLFFYEEETGEAEVTLKKYKNINKTIIFDIEEEEITNYTNELITFDSEQTEDIEFTFYVGSPAYETFQVETFTRVE